MREVILLSILVTAQAQAVAPRMFSPWYAESLRGILELDETDAARLERQVATHPEDFPARLKLMAYYGRADRAGRPQDRVQRVRHALWLIEHHPDSELLHSPVSRFSPGELTAADFRRAAALWDSAARARPRDAAVAWNAASFFEELDPALRLRYLEATAAADPNHPFALRPLADFYALSILERGRLAARAQAGLEASQNVWVLGNAAYMLQSQYNRTLQMGAPNPRAAELAERYFLRAKALDPKLNRKAILPQLDLQRIARVRPVPVDEALGKIRRLLPEAFPEFPPAVAGFLKARNCGVPQPSLDGARRNAIRGEFFTKGEAGWAVLCSAHNATALLAFRNDRDTHPDTVTSSDNGGKIGYAREISAVGRDFILRHYRAYGGPTPPPLDHQGIDDAFLEKASVTWYFYQGKWLRLQGAD